MSQNYYASEVAQFDNLAHRWWDPEGEFRPLHDLNPTRLAYIRSQVRLEGAAVLDVGCGGGLLAEGLARHGAQVTAIDAAPATLAAAELHAQESGLAIRYQANTVEALAAAEPDTRYAAITCLEMLEHVPNPAQVIATCAQLLVPGGKLFLSTLNRTPQSFALAIVGAEHILRLLPRGTHRYAQFIQPAELAGWLRAAGLTVTDLRGLAYNPLTRQARLTQDVSVNYLVCAQRDDE